MNTKDIKLCIYESYYNGYITDEKKDILLDRLNEAYVSEDVKEKLKAAKDKFDNSEKGQKVKEGFNKFSDKYNDGMNKRSEVFAKMVVKKPEKRVPKGQIPTSDVHKQYKEDMKKWRIRYKVSEILVTGCIALEPVDTVLKAATINGLVRSSDPIDKDVMSKVKEIKDKALSIKDKVKDIIAKVRKKDLNESELKKEINTIDAATSHLAKSIDITKKKVALAQESVSENDKLMCQNKVCNLLFNENCELVHSAFDIANTIIEKCDYTDPLEYYLAEYCVEILMNQI